MSKLTTENLELRVRTLADADGLFALYSDADVAKFIGGPCPDRDQVVKSVFLSDTQWRKNGFGFWSVYHKKSGDLAGACGLRKLVPSGDVELVIHLGKKYWKKGLGTEIGRAVLKFAFDLHKLPKLTATADPANLGGVKLLEKLGFNKQPDQSYVLTK